MGPCINIASRLQKLLSNVAVSKRGIDLSSKEKFYATKIVTIRGIGDNELIYVAKEAFDKLTLDEKRQFKDP